VISLIRHAWYAACHGSDLRETPIHAKVLGHDLVLFREATGVPRALRRYCPHRGCDLALGTVHGETLVCPFHGWHFVGRDGQCTHIPANATNVSIPRSVVAHVYAVHEEAGLIWVCVGDVSTTPPPLNLFSELVDPAYQRIPFRTQWQAHFTRSIESALDVSHLPFVHPSSTGSDVDPRVEGPDWATADTGLSMQPTPFAARHPMEPRPQTWPNEARVQICVNYPNHWIIRAPTGNDGMMCTFLTFTPVDDTTTEIFGYALRNFAQDAEFLDEYHLSHTLRVMDEDRVIVESIRPRQSPFDLHQEHHVSSDAPALRYRVWLKQAWEREQQH